MIIPAHVPKSGAPVAGEVEQRLAQRPAVDEPAHRGRLAARQDQAAEALEIGRQAHLDRLDADRVEHARRAPRIALDREDPDLHCAAALRRSAQGHRARKRAHCGA